MHLQLQADNRTKVTWTLESPIIPLFSGHLPLPLTVFFLASPSLLLPCHLLVRHETVLSQSETGHVDVVVT